MKCFTVSQLADWAVVISLYFCFTDVRDPGVQDQRDPPDEAHVMPGAAVSGRASRGGEGDRTQEPLERYPGWIRNRRSHRCLSGNKEKREEMGGLWVRESGGRGGDKWDFTWLGSTPWIYEALKSASAQLLRFRLMMKMRCFTLVLNRLSKYLFYVLLDWCYTCIPQIMDFIAVAG